MSNQSNASILWQLRNDHVTINGREFKIRPGFSEERFIEMMIESGKKTPVVFLSNLHTHPTPEFGYLVSSDYNCWRIAFVENLLTFCDEGYEDPAWECVTAKACEPGQCFVLHDWVNLVPHLEKKYLLDRQPVTAFELINEAKKIGYQGSEGVFRSSVAAELLRIAKHSVTENNYLTFKFKLI